MIAFLGWVCPIKCATTKCAATGRQWRRALRRLRPAEPSKPAAPLPGPERGQERPRRVFIERVPGDVQRDVQERLNDSPFVDASGISVSVAASEVTLDGTVDTPFAVSVAKSLASNVSGVGRVVSQLQVKPAPRGYAMVPDGA